MKSPALDLTADKPCLPPHRPDTSLRRPGPSPRRLVRAELARAITDLLLVPPRALGYALRRERHVSELRADLEHVAAPAPVPLAALPPGRPARLFVACAEVSGEIHAQNLVRALRRRALEAGAPAPELLGLGGERLAADGVHTLGDPVARAHMGFQGITKALPYYLGLLETCARSFQGDQLDAVVAVDSPALHVPMFHLARRYGLPTIHFVTPQYWGWAPWRVRGYASAVTLALSILPFEPAWFARRGVRVAHVGHPLLDELAARAATGADAPGGGRALVLLAGSRRAVIERNLPWMLEVAGARRAELGHPPVLVVHEREDLRGELEAAIDAAGARDWARVATGGLQTALADARAAFSVSGTVLLDLLHQRVPSVVVYRLANGRETWMKEHFLTAPWFSSVNLLAAREVFPEFCFHGAGPREAAGDALVRAWRDEAWRAGCRAGLDLANQRLGPAGACDRAAGHVLATAFPGPGSPSA